MGIYLAQELEKFGHTVVKTDLAGAEYKIDLLDKERVKKGIEEISPDGIIHLAGQSSVGLSWKNPQLTMNINVCGTLNILDAVRESGKDIRIVVIGSSDEYGKVAFEDCPIKETQPLAPVNPYAVSKCTQETMALLYAKAYGMDIVFTRSFSHSGPGQKKGFVVPDFCSEVAATKFGEKNIVKVGNLRAKREIADVRDVVRAYRLILEKGKNGEIYNVGCGKAYVIADILDMVIGLSQNEIKVVCDKSKMRPIDLPLIQGDISKLCKETGYCPRYSIEETIADTYKYWLDLENV